VRDETQSEAGGAGKEVFGAAVGEYVPNVEQDAGQERAGTETENSKTLGITMITAVSSERRQPKIL
jgi:hypothetical protein